MIESPRERRAMVTAWGDRAALASGVSFPIIFDEPGVIEIGMSGTGPTLLASRDDLTAQSVVIDTVLTITTAAGRAAGSFRVAVWSPEDDAEFIRLGLELQ